MQRVNELNERAGFKPRKPFTAFPLREKKLETRTIRFKAANFSDNPLNETGEGDSFCPFSLWHRRFCYTQQGIQVCELYARIRVRVYGTAQWGSILK